MSLSHWFEVGTDDAVDHTGQDDLDDRGHSAPARLEFGHDSRPEHLEAVEQLA